VLAAFQPAKWCGFTRALDIASHFFTQHASALPQLAATAAPKAAWVSERVRVGFIGIGGRGFGAHVKTLAKLKNDGENIELVAAADVDSVYRDKFQSYGSIGRSWTQKFRSSGMLAATRSYVIVHNSHGPLFPMKLFWESQRLESVTSYVVASHAM
jgi:hypothetical protein